MTASWLIQNAIIVSGSGREQVDVRVTNQRIVAIGPNLQPKGAEVVEATGKLLLPGLIDDQVHFREPGLTAKGNIASESAAALAGGITSVLEMPNTIPPTITLAALEHKYAIARIHARVNHAFYLGATGTNNTELRAAAAGPACGIKVFLGASTGNLLVEDEDLLEAVFSSIPTGMVLAAHCEDAARIRARQERICAAYHDAPPMRLHPQIRDATACLRATERAMRLARRHQVRLHVLHLSTRQEVALFAPGKLSEKMITAEVCLPHLWFSDQDYEHLGSRIKCNPAIKEIADRAALRAAVASGAIDAIATDHAPHTIAEKQALYGAIAAGMPMAETSLLVLLALVKEAAFSLEQVVQLACHNPALLFGIRDRGYIREGYFADLVLVDQNRTTTISDHAVKSKCGWTPLAGTILPAAIEAVWVSGQLAWHKGQLVDQRGLRIEFKRRAA